MTKPKKKEQKEPFDWENLLEIIVWIVMTITVPALLLIGIWDDILIAKIVCTVLVGLWAAFMLMKYFRYREGFL